MVRITDIRALRPFFAPTLVLAFCPARKVAFFLSGTAERLSCSARQVILSGETDRAVQAEMLEAGAARVLLKPASLDQLKALRQLVMPGGSQH